MDMGNILPLIGPRSEDRLERNIMPEEVRLADGSPLYHLFLASNEAGVVDGVAVRDAKSELHRLISVDADSVLRCQGKTKVEALAILASLKN